MRIYFAVLKRKKMERAKDSDRKERVEVGCELPPR